MPGFLTKEQVAKLSPEEQEVVARVALDEARFRRGILAKAEGYRGYRLVPAILWTVAAGFLIWKSDAAMMLPFVGLLAVTIFQFHVAGINSRIDAVIRLLDLKQSIDEPGQHSPSAELGRAAEGSKE